MQQLLSLLPDWAGYTQCKLAIEQCVQQQCNVHPLAIATIICDYSASYFQRTLLQQLKLATIYGMQRFTLLNVNNNTNAELWEQTIEPYINSGFQRHNVGQSFIGIFEVQRHPLSQIAKNSKAFVIIILNNAHYAYDLKYLEVVHDRILENFFEEIISLSASTFL